MTSGPESNLESRTETAGRGITVPGSDFLVLRMTPTFEIELQLDCEGFAGVDILDYGYVLSREREDWAEW